MTPQQKTQKILALPHGQEVWTGLQTIQDVTPGEERTGVNFEDHPLHDEIAEALRILLA